MSETTKFVLNVGAAIVIAVAALRLLFMEVVVVQDNSMAPTLVHGDRALVWKGASIDMADVVLCEQPGRSGVLVVSRAVAFAGHTVRTDHNGMLYVDDDRTTTHVDGRVRFYDVTRERLWDMELRSMDYFGRHSHAYFIEHGALFRLMPNRVEKGVYLLGDNRSGTDHDSRSFGEADPERCLGQVFMRLSPGPSRGDELAAGYLEFIE